jgi:hypothetical protein
MKLLQTISQKLARKSTKVKMFASIVLVATSLSGAIALAGYTPANRPTFDYNKGSDSSNCANPNDPGYDHGRCGSLNGPVLNSFVNTPYYGDERAFFDASLDNNTTSFKDVLPNVASNGSSDNEVILRTYIHNNGNQNLNGNGTDGISVAKGATIRITLPTGTEKNLRARSYLDISNPAPGSPAEVTDTAELNDGQAFSISYVPGSAVIYNGAHQGGAPINDSIVTTGAPIGYQDMNGVLPGCFNYQAFVEIKVKINTPKISIKKQVRPIAGDGTSYVKNMSVAPGDQEHWALTVSDTGTTNLDNSVVYDQLPPHLKVVPGSVKWQYVARDGTVQKITQSDTDLFNKYVNFGGLAPGGGYNVYYDTTALDDFTGCSVDIRNIGHTHSDETPADTSDYSDVTITKPNCNPNPPVYSCDLLTLTPGTVDQQTGNATYTLTANASATNATIKSYSFNFGDGTAAQVIAVANGENTISTTHTYAPGTYNAGASVTVLTNVGETKTVSSANCMKPVTVSPLPAVLTCVSLDTTGATADAQTGAQLYTFTANASAVRATITSYVFNFGDSTTPATVTTANTTASTTHTYQPGTWLSSVTVSGKDASGAVVTATSAACAKQVSVQRPECKPGVPAGSSQCFTYTCNLFTVSKGDNHLVTVGSFNASTSNSAATLKNVVVDWGDGTTPLTANTVIGQQHQYAADGSYTITAVAHFTVPGQSADATAGGANCVQTVSYTTPPPVTPPTPAAPVTPTTPAAPTVLPNTGAGSVVGLFGAAVIIGTIAHRLFLGRRLSRQ